MAEEGAEVVTVQDVENMTLSKRSRSAYFSYQHRFLTFLLEKYPIVLKRSFKTSYHGTFPPEDLQEEALRSRNSAKVNFLRQWLQLAPRNAPLKFDSLTPDMLVVKKKGWS
jgi:hypothetical protein